MAKLHIETFDDDPPIGVKQKLLPIQHPYSQILDLSPYSPSRSSQKSVSKKAHRSGSNSRIHSRLVDVNAELLSLEDQVKQLKSDHATCHLAVSRVTDLEGRFSSDQRSIRDLGVSNEELLRENMQLKSDYDAASLSVEEHRKEKKVWELELQYQIHQLQLSKDRHSEASRAECVAERLMNTAERARKKMEEKLEVEMMAIEGERTQQRQLIEVANNKAQTAEVAKKKADLQKAEADQKARKAVEVSLEAEKRERMGEVGKLKKEIEELRSKCWDVEGAKDAAEEQKVTAEIRGGQAEIAKMNAEINSEGHKEAKKEAKRKLAMIRKAHDLERGMYLKRIEELEEAVRKVKLEVDM